jgi:hypothetical protein
MLLRVPPEQPLTFHDDEYSEYVFSGINAQALIIRATLFSEKGIVRRTRTNFSQAD